MNNNKDGQIGKILTAKTHDEIGTAEKQKIVEEMLEKIVKTKEGLKKLEDELRKYILENNLASQF